jgi:hypothetical protein
VAGQYLLGPMFPPSVVGVFLVFSIAAFLAGRPLLAVLCSSIALVVHPTYLLSAAWLTASYLAILAWQRRYRQALGLALCALALALPIVLYNALVFGPSDAETFARANSILARERFPHHCVPDQWLDETALAQTARVAVALLLVRDGRLLTILATSLLGVFLLTGVQMATDSDALALLFPWRSSVYPVPLALAIVLGRGIALIPACRRAGNATPPHPQPLSPKGERGESLGRSVPPEGGTPTPLTLKAACLVVLAGLASVGVRQMLDAAAALGSHRDAALFAFVHQSKTADAVYLIPTRMERFRLATGACIFVDYKSHPYKDRQVLEWFDRLRQAEAFYAAGAERRVAVLRDLAHRYGVTHAVVGGDDELAGQGFTEVYRDGRYRVFRIDTPQSSGRAACGLGNIHPSRGFGMHESLLPAGPVETGPPATEAIRWRRCFALGAGCYLLTTAVVVVGVLLGQSLLKPGKHRRPERHDAVAAFAAWDGDWYGRIAGDGYDFDPSGRSRVAFLPVYPMLGRLLARLTGLDPLLSLLLISHLSLAAAFGVAAAYLRQRLPDAPEGSTDYVLLSMGLFPPTLFFRMAYTESLFLLLMILVLYGTIRQWPLLVLAPLVGLATGTRVAGLAFLPPFLLHVWRRSPSPRSRLTRLALLTPLSCWGIAAFMVYTWSAFGRPLAFVEAHHWWRQRPAVPLADKLLDLAALEPIWSLLDPAAKLYWGKREDAGLGPFCYGLMDPFFFLVAAAAVLVGAFKRWLSAGEILLGVGLLLIAYVGRGHEMGMTSSARFGAVVFPAYLTMGQLLVRTRPLWATGILGMSAMLLGLYSALFTAWYRVF